MIVSKLSPVITTAIGPNEKGNTRSVIVPKIFAAIENNQPMLICDPKCEILDYIGDKLASNSYKILNINLRDPKRSMSWNPLLTPYKYFMAGEEQKAYSALSDIARNIYESLGGDSNDFWDSSAYDFFTAIVSSLYSNASIDQINLKSILMMIIEGEEKFATSDFIKEYFLLEPDDSFPFLCSHNVLYAPTETRGGIISVFKNSLRKLTASDKYSSILCFNDFNLDECLDSKTAIILNYQDENPFGAAIITVFIDMLYKYIIDERTLSPTDVIYNFFLDDFLSIPKLFTFDNILLSSKARNISLYLSIENMNIFEKKYGKESKMLLFSLSDDVYYFRDKDLATYNYLVSICKQRDIIIGNNDFQDNKVLLISDKEIPKVIPLNPVEKQTFKREYMNIHYNMPVNIFPIKEYVKQKKRQKLFDALDNADKKPDTPAPMEKPSFDVDDLVRRIDLRIADLEKEEEESKQNSEGNQ